jgi:hypothetical protein
MNKYNIGDVVHCYRKETLTQTGFDFTGVILSVANAGYIDEEDWEYDVENAPIISFFGQRCLIWESEITALT